MTATEGKRTVGKTVRVWEDDREPKHAIDRGKPWRITVMTVTVVDSTRRYKTQKEAERVAARIRKGLE